MHAKCFVQYMQNICSLTTYVDDRCKVRIHFYNILFHNLRRQQLKLFYFTLVWSRYLLFDVPAIWRQPMCHEVDCYFCLIKVKQHGRHRTVEYAHVHSFTKPILHSPSVPYPVCPKRKIQQQIDDLFGSSDLNKSNVELEKNPKPLTQFELNDWIRD